MDETAGHTRRVTRRSLKRSRMSTRGKTVAPIDSPQSDAWAEHQFEQAVALRETSTVPIVKQSYRLGECDQGLQALYHATNTYRDMGCKVFEMEGDPSRRCIAYYTSEEVEPAHLADDVQVIPVDPFAENPSDVSSDSESDIVYPHTDALFNGELDYYNDNSDVASPKSDVDIEECGGSVPSEVLLSNSDTSQVALVSDNLDCGVGSPSKQEVLNLSLEDMKSDDMDMVQNSLRVLDIEIEALHGSKNNKQVGGVKKVDVVDPLGSEANASFEKHMSGVTNMPLGEELPVLTLDDSFTFHNTSKNDGGPSEYIDKCIASALLNKSDQLMAECGDMLAYVDPPLQSPSSRKSFDFLVPADKSHDSIMVMSTPTKPISAGLINMAAVDPTSEYSKFTMDISKKALNATNNNIPDELEREGVLAATTIGGLLEKFEATEAFRLTTSTHIPSANVLEPVALPTNDHTYCSPNKKDKGHKKSTSSRKSNTNKRKEEKNNKQQKDMGKKEEQSSQPPERHRSLLKPQVQDEISSLKKGFLQVSQPGERKTITEQPAIITNTETAKPITKRTLNLDDYWKRRAHIKSCESSRNTSPILATTNGQCSSTPSSPRGREISINSCANKTPQQLFDPIAEAAKRAIMYKRLKKQSRPEDAIVKSKIPKQTDMVILPLATKDGVLLPMIGKASDVPPPADNAVLPVKPLHNEYEEISVVSIGVNTDPQHAHSHNDQPDLAENHTILFLKRDRVKPLTLSTYSQTSAADYMAHSAHRRKRSPSPEDSRQRKRDRKTQQPDTRYESKRYSTDRVSHTSYTSSGSYGSSYDGRRRYDDYRRRNKYSSGSSQSSRRHLDAASNSSHSPAWSTSSASTTSSYRSVKSDNTSYSSDSRRSDRYSTCRDKYSRSPLDSYRRGWPSSPSKLEQMEERKVVYVGRLDQDMTREQFRNMFTRFGYVKEATLHRKTDGSRYGFVTFLKSQQSYQVVECATSDPILRRYDVSFGGRRVFCRNRYADLDRDLENDEYEDSAPHPVVHRKSNGDSFDSMLQGLKQAIEKKKQHRKAYGDDPL